jgi:hypothetical protein
MTNVDQQKIRRIRTGLIAYDPALAQPGYTLFTPMFGDGTSGGETVWEYISPHFFHEAGAPGVNNWVFCAFR